MDADLKTAMAALTTACPPPAPDVAAAFAAARFGIWGQAVPLGGERDANFRIITGTGQDRVLKIANPAESRAVIEMQMAALDHLARKDPALPVPRSHAAIETFAVAGAPPRLAWMVSFLPGRVLASVPQTAALRRQTGQMLARLTHGLADFDHPAASRPLLWDLRQAGQLLPLLPYITDAVARADVTTVLTRVTPTAVSQLSLLPQAVVHADFNAHNLLVDDLGTEIAGILDFGDMLRTARVADLAVAASYHVGEDDAPLAPVADLVAGYDSLIPLNAQERDLLPALIATRLAMSVTIGEWRAALYPDNSAYILRNVARGRRRLRALLGGNHV